MEPIGDFVRRVIFGVRSDLNIDKLIVRIVFDREPDWLNVIFREIFSETSLTFARPERTRTHSYLGQRLFLRARDKVRIAIRVQLELECVH